MFANGVQFGSVVSAGLPPPTRMAVTGRQKLLAFQHPIPASAYAAQSMAINRALSEVLSSRSEANLRNARAYCRPVCSVQNNPISVCAGVRTVLLSAPSVFVSL